MTDEPPQDMRRERAEQAALNQAQAQAPTEAERRAYMESVLDSDIDDATIKMISNMLASDYMLANLKEAEVHELKKLRQIVLKKVTAAHPHPDSVMQGKLREQVYEGTSPGLKPLNQTQKAKIDGLLKTAFANLTRGREGFQQEEFSKTISESRVEENESGDSGGYLSFS